MLLDIVHGEWNHLEIAVKMDCPQRNQRNETMTYIFPVSFPYIQLFHYSPANGLWTDSVVLSKI